MSGTSVGGKKAAATLKAQDPQAMVKRGRSGAMRRHAKSPEEESRIAKRAAATRLLKDPDAFKKMGRIRKSRSDTRQAGSSSTQEQRAIRNRGGGEED